MPLSLCPCSLSLMLTLFSFISAECCNCSLWDRREPWLPCTPWPGASQYGSFSAAVAVSLFFSAVPCLQKGQGWLPMPIKPAASERSTSSSPTSGIAPTPWLKWYGYPLSLHGNTWRPPSVPWFLAFIISLSFICTSPGKNPQTFAVRQKLSWGIVPLPTGGVAEGTA